MNKLQSNRLNDSITKLQSSDDKMILLNLISQEHNKYIHYKIEKDKFKSVLKDLLKNPQEFNESSKSQELQESQEIHESIESQELQESQEIHESNSEFEIKNEMEQIENNLEFDTIYEKKRLG